MIMRDPDPDSRTFLRSLRGKLTCFVVLPVALATVALTLSGYAYVREMLRDNLRERLHLHGEGLREVVRAYAGQQEERVSLVASRTRLRQLLRQRLDGEIARAPFLEQTRRILLDAQRSTRGFVDVRIADPEGRVPGRRTPCRSVRPSPARRSGSPRSARPVACPRSRRPPAAR